MRGDCTGNQFVRKTLVLAGDFNQGLRMPKKVLVALPPGLLEQVDFVAQVELRNRSDLIREALRRYIEEFKHKQSLHMIKTEARNEKIAVLSEPQR
jgi:Arc/MetJ-type ribon-helix-helix transcriptional regulator